jgi:hypothetical protein
MTIDLSKLSAKELFELALRKEQEEQLLVQRQAQLAELQKQRGLLISAHDVALADIERKITELTSQRAKLIVDHEKSMSAIGKEIGELMRQIEAEMAKPAAPTAPAIKPSAAVPPRAATPAAPPPKPAPAPVAPPPPAPAAPAPAASLASEAAMGMITIDDKDELFEKVRELMRTRSFISHSLLKEQLKTKGYNIPNLSKLVDQLIREGKLASAGGGNYALGKKA